MKLVIHRLMAITATFCVVTFFIITIATELFGTLESVALVKSLIVMPGVFVLISAMAITGATGFSLAKNRQGGLISRKKKRMPILAINGLFILLPSAIILDQWASAGDFDAQFYTLQALELIAGAINSALMIMNIRDGRKLVKAK